MQSQNAMTLHTSASCSMNSQSCAGQPGCGTQNAGSLSYGDGFNNNKGGVYAMEWTSDNIKIWFWPRGSVPSDALGEAPNPSSWGEPMTHFAGGNGCTIDDHFNKNNIVFDTTFCGDWAGSVWGSTTECSAKAATCQDYVRDNPSAFTEAYWTINSLKVYSFNSAATSGRVDAQPDDSPVPYPVAVPSPTTSNAPLAETPTTSSILAVVPQPTTSPAPIIAAPASTPESDNMAVVIGLDGRIREMPVSESHTVRRNRTKARALGFEEVLQGGEVPVKRDGDVHGGITSRHLRRHQLGGLRGHSHS